MTRCDTCHLQYVESDAHDRRTHAAYCRRWSRATETLGYTPAFHPDREAAKSEGYRQVSDGTTREERLAGALAVVRAWFDRSLEAAIHGGYWRGHLRFDGYAAQIHPSLPESWPADVKQALRDRYGEEPGIIPPGCSYWLPRGKARTAPWRDATRQQDAARQEERRA